MISLILISAIFAIVIYKILNNKKIPNGLKELPSAPGGLPVVGHLFKMGAHAHKYLTDISMKTGPIYKIQIGWKEIIVLNNFDTMEKCLQVDGTNFAGRWSNTFTEQLARYCGLIFKDKEWWSTQRHFSLRSLKDFGFGKSQTEVVIGRETEKIIDNIKSSNEKPIFTADLFSLTTINVISDFILKKEFMENDPEMIDLMRNIRKFVQGSELQMILINVFPIFKSFPNIENQLYRILDNGQVVEIVENTYKFITKFVEEQRERFNPNNECHNLIDAFLLEQHRLKEQNIKNHSFTDFQLIRLVTELFVAGFETTSTTLTWAMLLLSKFPNIQQRARNEIIDTIGVNRIPTMADKKCLPYFQAVLDEIARFVSIVPLSLPHKVFNDTSVDGFFIRQGSIIFPNIYACHRDPNVWEKPNEFYPEHFLTSDGKYNPRPELMPFGIGKRICVGESLAKMEFFIFTAAIIQKFSISFDQTYEKNNDDLILEGTGGLIRGSVEHKVIFKEI